MPHVVVKLYSGRSEQQKAKLAEEIVKTVTAALNCGEESVSVGIEDVAPANWTKDVYQPDIRNHWETLYKKPGYEPR